MGKRLPSRLAARGGPGLALTAAAVAVAWAANRVWPTLSPLTAAVVLGVVAANVLPPAVRSATRSGVQVAAKRVMRLGIVLLGLQLPLDDVLHLGWQTLAFVVAAVFVTFFGTQWIGRRLGLPGRQPLLIATGFAICGASAVAAMEGVTRQSDTGGENSTDGGSGSPDSPDSVDDPDPVVAVALVTLCGSLAILVLPLLRGPLGLGDPASFGHWVGASVHDVGQVVATAGAGGATAVNGAIVVKLMRVAMLAPVVAGTAVFRRASAGSGGEQPAEARQPLLPLFVAGFLAMIALRTTGALPAPALSAAKQLQDLLLAAGMFGLGCGVRLRELVRTGPRPLALGLASWALIAGCAYIGVRISG